MFKSLKIKITELIHELDDLKDSLHFQSPEVQEEAEKAIDSAVIELEDIEDLIESEEAMNSLKGQDREKKIAEKLKKI